MSNGNFIFKTLNYANVLEFLDSKIINFPFVSNGKLMDLGVPNFKHIPG